MTRKLTDEIYDLIPALIAEGKTKAEIAETYGVTTSTLQVQCCRRGISLRQGGPRIKLSLGLSDAALCALRMAAKARGKDESGSRATCWRPSPRTTSTGPCSTPAKNQ